MFSPLVGKKTISIAEMVDTFYSQGPLHYHRDVPEEFRQLRLLSFEHTKEKGNVVANQAMYNYNRMKTVARKSSDVYFTREITEAEIDSIKSLYTSNDEAHVLRTLKRHNGDAIHLRWILAEMIWLYATKGNMKAKNHVYFKYGKWIEKPSWKGTRGQNSNVIFVVPKNFITGSLIKPFETQEQPNGVWFDDLRGLHNLVSCGLIRLDEAIWLLDKCWGL